MNPTLFVIVAIFSYVVLYYIIKYAIKNAIIEAHRDINITVEEDDYNGIAKVICTNCGNKHEMDYPKCPHCGYTVT